MKLSVVIPVKNGSATLNQCLSSIRMQTINDIEIIVLDSMSTDNSIEIAKKYDVVLIEIPEGSFNHGLTRNIGAEKATGELLYFTVQDAWLPDPKMLENMSSHFKDEELAAVAGHQVTPWGHLDKNPVLWFKRYTKPVVTVRQFLNNSFKDLNLKEQFEKSGWDNVNAMYSRSALLEIPFEETNFSEDWLWANNALAKGSKLLYDPSAVVYHYHHMFFGYTIKSKFIVNYYFYKFFKKLPSIPLSPMGLIRAIYILIKRKEIPFTKKIYWMFYNFSFASANFLSIFLFRFAYLLGKDSLLNRTYKLVCSKVPQGKLK